jgi:hypothetical protein
MFRRKKRLEGGDVLNDTPAVTTEPTEWDQPKTFEEAIEESKEIGGRKPVTAEDIDEEILTGQWSSEKNFVDQLITHTIGRIAEAKVMLELTGLGSIKDLSKQADPRALKQNIRLHTMRLAHLRNLRVELQQDDLPPRERHALELPEDLRLQVAGLVTADDQDLDLVHEQEEHA